MNSRKFIRDGSIAGFTFSSLGVASCNPPLKTEKNTKEIGTPPPFPDDFVLNEVSIDELNQKMESGEYTSREITGLYLKRIEEIDKKGIRLNSVIELNPDALGIADSMDRERKAGRVRGPMHGIPVLIKDNINTGDKMMTTAGS